MSQSESFDDAEIERLLGAGRDSPADRRLRNELLEQTTRVIRSRRRIRRFGWVLGMAACYLAGLATMYFVAAVRTDREPVQLVQESPRPLVAPVDEVPPVTEEAAESRSPADLPASVLERLADLAPDDTFRDMYRQAGDRYMTETGDLAAALRCYRHALKFAPPQSLIIGEKDNWLFASLKQAKLEEFQHANNGG